jgi:MFS family permease
MVYSVLNGIGGCLIFTPCIASVGHFFLVKRGNATGIAMTSGSIGGIIFPLMLQKLFPTVGFAWATRILGFILLFILTIANLLVRSRLPRKPMASLKSVSPDLTVFKDLPFAFVSLGIFLMEWGIFVPLTYFLHYLTRLQLRLQLPNHCHTECGIFLRPVFCRLSRRHDWSSQHSHSQHWHVCHLLLCALAPGWRFYRDDNNLRYYLRLCQW